MNTTSYEVKIGRGKSGIDRSQHLEVNKDQRVSLIPKLKISQTSKGINNQDGRVSVSVRFAEIQEESSQ